MVMQGMRLFFSTIRDEKKNLSNLVKEMVLNVKTLITEFLPGNLIPLL